MRGAMRSLAWELWSDVLAGRGNVPGATLAQRELPERGPRSVTRTLRLAHLLRFRRDATVLADRIGVAVGELWGSGVSVGVSDDNGELLLEFPRGTVLAARRVATAGRVEHVRLVISPTELPLLLS